MHRIALAPVAAVERLIVLDSAFAPTIHERMDMELSDRPFRRALVHQPTLRAEWVLRLNAELIDTITWGKQRWSYEGGYEERRS